MRLAVIIPSYNRLHKLEILVNQLLHQKLPPNLDTAIFVINDGSADGTYEYLKELNYSIKQICGNGLWYYTKSMNIGFKAAKDFKPDFILALNDDIEIEENYIANLVSAIDILPDNSIVGSVSTSILNRDEQLYFGVKKIKWWLNKSIEYSKNDFIGNKILPTKTLPGRGMLIPYKVLESLNFFDEKYIQYGSDDEFCLRATKHGFGVYLNSNAIVFTNPNSTNKFSPINKPSIIKYIGSWFNKRSSTYLGNSIRLHLSYGPIITIPFAIIFMLAGRIKSLIKHR